MASAAASAAGIIAANVLNSQTAKAVDTKNAAAVGEGPFPAEGMAANSPTGPHKPMKFQRRALGPKDVAIKIHYCGACHSDIHTIRGNRIRTNIRRVSVMSRLGKSSGLVQVPANSPSVLESVSPRCCIHVVTASSAKQGMRTIVLNGNSQTVGAQRILTNCAR